MKEICEIEVTLPEQIRFYRQKQGLTQRQLSELVNVTEHYISEIENAIKFPSMELIKNISLALNVPIYCLMMPRDNIRKVNFFELQKALSTKDEAELTTMLGVLIIINEMKNIDAYKKDDEDHTEYILRRNDECNV